MDITEKLIDSGFSCVYPWAWSSNTGMVVHNPDGTHTIKKLPIWMKSQLTGRSVAEKEVTIGITKRK